MHICKKESFFPERITKVPVYSWGSGGWLASSRRLSSFVVVVASQIRCHWGKLLQVTLHGCVTCQAAPLFHCDLHDNDMSRKKRDAQAQRFVRSADSCAVALGLAFGESCFWGVGCGRAIGICVSGCGIEARFS